MKILLNDDKIQTTKAFSGEIMMTIKQQVLNEITKISEEEPILQEILDIIATHRSSIQRTTKNGRAIRTQGELESLDCPYRFEADL